ncbi:hypothetical protein [Archaeoglobus profundus]|uniref:Uncharacterized protein n=1 Tax=Archaeoglobus profundus (strain DSM 5631 / JCM 9629 / NBRC 100127 / Av18) TaxID=572546 RepID=D2REB5_ARCPA|nr:hypothetical protein [Archaeoglobus profundus]ADB58459.1 hypothetical protein Arcpr_1411 [Archaeoglobus profundus DSM 5631]
MGSQEKLFCLVTLTNFELIVFKSTARLFKRYPIAVVVVAMGFREEKSLTEVD